MAGDAGMLGDVYPVDLPKKGAKDTRGTVKFIDRKQTDNAMAEKEKDKQTHNRTEHK